MRVLALPPSTPLSNDPTFIEQMKVPYQKACPIDFDPDTLFDEVVLRTAQFPQRKEDLVAPPEEEWRVTEVGTLPEGLPYFSTERTSDGATVDFAMSGPIYYIGNIKFNGDEQWFTGQQGPTPIPDLEDPITLQAMTAHT